MTRRSALVALVCASALLFASCSGDDDDDADGSRSTSSTTATSTTSTTAPGDATTTTTAAPMTPVTLPPVAVGTAADLGGSLFVTVTSIEPTSFTAEGPGLTTGPGVIVKIEVRNDTSTPVDLSGIAVNAHYGDAVPAVPNVTPAGGLRGTVAPGATATGEYGFRVPEDQQGSVVVDIQHSATPNVVIVDAAQ